MKMNKCAVSYYCYCVEDDTPEQDCSFYEKSDYSNSCMFKSTGECSNVEANEHALEIAYQDMIERKEK